MPRFNVLLLSFYSHLTVNHLNLKDIRRSVMAEW